MTNNISTKAKLMSFPLMFLVIIIISIVTFSYYHNLSEKRNSAAFKTELFIQDLLRIRILANQFLMNPSENRSKKTIKSLEQLNNKIINFKKSLSHKENRNLCDEILKVSTQYLKDFKKLSKEEFLNNNSLAKNNKEYLFLIKQMVDSSNKLEELMLKINKSATLLKNESIETMEEVLISMAAVFIILFSILSVFILKQIISSLDDFKEGLESFFKYLNREAKQSKLLDDKRKDEFGVMAKMVNSNILTTEKSIQEDRDVIQKVIDVLSELEKGDLYQRVKTKSSNPALQKLISLLNEMSENLESNVDRVLNILDEYSNYKYRNKVQTNNLKEHLLRLATGVNTLGDSITQMLIDNESNGIVLGKSSDVLIQNVDVLNRNSNEAAAALEETAAALEEITGNIVSNTQNVVKMSDYAKQLSNSANEGQNLASKTTSAMDEINDKVNSINEAIAVIDQIAFQTNILSLNAAVEAATAGDAGKGFAVVAQEVRNLASKSAEAAKRIKDLVEDATLRANEGKKIADDMIEGYEGLNENIKNTLEIISDVEMASKEQSTGIEQINDAVTSLDQQTQENAQIATQTHEISMETDKIAKLIITSVNEKDFINPSKKDEFKNKKEDSANLEKIVL
ncbi:methyl-accepting chemotaxis protein [Halarcobacter anaerophilus]|uniref:methyl-accepting chemotaxis protein n=1 Tax=Halarcobacter anaerophilus TaxID=877500 RepID=UPI0005CA579F|nr:methyl-accepting chemotaxis protein [Halarcobacter anaerophilus]